MPVLTVIRLLCILQGIVLTTCYRSVSPISSPIIFVSTQSITVSVSSSSTMKGRHLIATTPMCRSRCISCHLCELYCPALAIILLGSQLLLRSSSIWTLDSYRCIVCGMCQDVCPVVAITERFSHQPSRTDVHPYPVLS